MKNYQDLMKHVLTVGQREPNRTGIDTITTPGEILRFDLRDGFPAVTTKKLAFDPVKGEYISFLNGATSAAEFRANGCKVWDQNANENAAWLANPNRKGTDDLGPVYGSQWRSWGGEPQILTDAPFLPDHLLSAFDFTWEGKTGIVAQRRIDQLANALHDIRNNSQSRRIIVTAWNPAVIDKIALPACHMCFQFLPRSDGTLHMTMLMRSVDLLLGAPFNIAGYALLLELFSAWTGRTAATLTMFLSDTHIYTNHLDQVEEQLSRTPFAPPQLSLTVPIDAETLGIDELVTALTPGDIQLVNYQHHAAIKAPMAV